MKMVDDELLSAYVDGELSDAERTRVEAWLRDDARARQLVDDLRSVSATLRELPRHKLGDDLRETVLEQAVVHRAPLLEEDQDSIARRWIWAVMALAATFFLAVYMPKTGDNGNQVAQVDAHKREAAKAGPWMIGAADSPADRARQIAGADSTLSAPRGIDQGVVTFDGQLEGAGARGQIEAQPEATADGAAVETLEVHLVPADPQIGPADFDKLLADFGIALLNESRETESETGETDTADVEMVLVEASAADIQELIAAFGSPNSQWRSQRVSIRHSGDTSGELMADQEAKTSASDGNGVAVALENLHLPNESAADSEPATAQTQSDSPPRGWAAHFGRDYATLSLEALKRATPKYVPTDLPGTTMRALFILHPAAE